MGPRRGPEPSGLNVNFPYPSASCCSLIVQAFLGIPILSKTTGGLEQNLRCILHFIANSHSDAHSRQVHLPTPAPLSVTFLLKLLCGILTDDKLLHIFFH